MPRLAALPPLYEDPGWMWVRIALLSAVLAGGVGVRAAAAAPSPRSAPVIIFYAPLEAPATARNARDSLEALARQRATVLIDLSPPPEVAPRAGEHLRRAIEAYQDFQYDRARELLEQGLIEVAETGAHAVSREELSDLLIYRGLVHTQRGDDAHAWEDFVRAAVVAPTRRLDPVRFPPRVIESFNRAVSTVQADPPAEITVEAPAACELWVDGEALGAQRTVPLRRGEHYLRARCPQSEPAGSRFTADAAATVRPELARRVHPDLAQAADEARRRGADSLIWASTVVAEDGARTRATLTLRLIDLRGTGPTGKELARVFTRLGSGADVAGAAGGLVDRIVTPARPLVVAEPQRWYQRPWLWGVAGAAIATAIILPFAIGSGQPDSWGSGVPK